MKFSVLIPDTIKSTRIEPKNARIAYTEGQF
jgi:hypothetical protein